MISRRVRPAFCEIYARFCEYFQTNTGSMPCCLAIIQSSPLACFPPHRLCGGIVVLRAVRSRSRNQPVCPCAMAVISDTSFI